MNTVEIEAYAKINLSIDVLGKRPDGYHTVEMVMDHVNLHDTVILEEEVQSDPEEWLHLHASAPQLADPRENLAWKAAERMREYVAEMDKEAAAGGEPSNHWIIGGVRIRIRKRIPVAAGLAGGSADAAAVLLGLNSLWNLDLPLEVIMWIGAELGNDVPFCVMGQAFLNPQLKMEGGAVCALARDKGQAVTPVRSPLTCGILSTPQLELSTGEIYEAADKLSQPVHPDNQSVLRGLEIRDFSVMTGGMANILEQAAEKDYPEITELKEKLRVVCEPEGAIVQMSGSGPTVFALFPPGKEEQARAAFAQLKDLPNTHFVKVF